MKPKINRAGSLVASSPFDRCQTPPYAIKPLIPYIGDSVVWEPARGDGMLAGALLPHVRKVIATDVLQGFNYFDTPLPDQVTRIVTNPPYSIKFQWLKRTHEFGIPWALLLPVEILGAKQVQPIFRQGIEVIFISPRINFKMPSARRWRGSSAQFPTCWITWGFGIGKENTFLELQPEYPPDDPGPESCDHVWAALLKDEFGDPIGNGVCNRCGLSYYDYAKSDAGNGWEGM